MVQGRVTDAEMERREKLESDAVAMITALRAQKATPSSICKHLQNTLAAGFSWGRDTDTNTTHITMHINDTNTIIWRGYNSTL